VSVFDDPARGGTGYRLSPTGSALLVAPLMVPDEYLKSDTKPESFFREDKMTIYQETMVKQLRAWAVASEKIDPEIARIQREKADRIEQSGNKAK